ncbi:MAG: Bacterial regulatory protein luxR family [Candidatus Eremiobacteraeota bacterium]|nr:Bacterial regulatory protein luxR family [Candidatus Eremiobacteraeota bacterium]
MTLKSSSVDNGIADVLPPNPLAVTAASLVTSAREAYLCGDFPQCVSMLERRSFAEAHLRTEALFILSRALLRLQRSMDVVELIGPVLSTFTHVDEVCTARMLYGTAVARAQDADRGLELLVQAAALADSGRAHRAIRAEIEYYQGLAYWTKRDFKQATRCATATERAKLDILSVRAIQLRAFAASASANYQDALRKFERARHLYGLCRGRDLALATQIICQIAVLEMTLRSARVPGSHAAPSGRTIPGTAFVPTTATQARMVLDCADSWLYAHDGDQVTAVRKAHEAIGHAPSAAWRTWSMASGANVFHAFGESGNARYLADEAEKIADSVDWNATADEERIGLLLLSEAYAAVKPAAAATVLARYDGVTTKMDPTRLLRDPSADPRLVAWDAYVRGLVARINGDYERAGELLRKSAEGFTSCGYLWRAALALIELDATPVDTRGELPLERAAVIVRDNFPASFLARRLGSWAWAYVDPVASALTPAQRDVLRRLLEGKNPVAIAAETNRTVSTVRTHVEHINRAFGTHSYLELFAACSRRGIGLPEVPSPDTVEAFRRTS